MSFQNLSTYPLSDPNSWLENHLQDPPPEKEPRSQRPTMAMTWRFGIYPIWFPYGYLTVVGGLEHFFIFQILGMS